MMSESNLVQRTVIRRRRQGRSGITLVDTVGSVVSTGLLLSFMAVILGQSFRSQSKALEQLQRIQRLQNASDRFRADVRLTTRVSIENDQLILDFGENGQGVRYQLQPGPDDDNSDAQHGWLTRILLQDNQQQGRERWDLGLRQLNWSVARDGRQPLVRCELMQSRRNDAPIVWLARAPLANSDSDVDSAPNSVPEAEDGGP